MKQKIKDIGTIYRIINYGDSSLVLNVICKDLGSIAMLAKGVRNKSHSGLVSVLNEYEFMVYEPSEPGLYLLGECSQTHEANYNNNAQTMAAATAGLELVGSLMLSNDEHEMYYSLIRKYLEYLEEVKSGVIALFWRFAIRIFQYQGIDIDLNGCNSCKNAGHTISGIDLNIGNPLCDHCLNDTVRELNRYYFAPSTIELLELMPSIGNHLDKISISKNNVNDMDIMLKAYYEHHFQKPFKLKSLSVLEQFYY